MSWRRHIEAASGRSDAQEKSGPTEVGKKASEEGGREKSGREKVGREKVGREGGKKASVKKAAKKKAAKKTPKPVKLGRPKVTAEEDLYYLFKKDYGARQVFDFLGVRTVGELERHEPQEIIRRLTKPIRDSVERIRQQLAEKNRSLSGDVEFALEFQAKQQREESAP